MYLMKSGLLISTCLLGVFLAASVATGCTEETEPTVSGPAIISPPTDTPVPSVGGDANSGQFNAVEANPRDGRARRDNG